MAIKSIPAGTSFHGVASEVPTENKGSEQTNSRRSSYTIEDITAAGGAAGGTELIDEGNGNGLVITGRTAANYGNVGLNAVDLGYSASASTTIGATAIYSNVLGGYNNTASGDYSTVSGGYSNTDSGTYGNVISGGGRNSTSGDNVTVAGGYNNTASGNYNTISGGGSNTTTSGYYATIGGGSNNTASGAYSIISGGGFNTASGYYATIGGGNSNTGSGYYTTIGGGSFNTASSYQSTVSGGFSNNIDVDSQQSTIGGGTGNVITGFRYSTIGGGRTNSVTALNGTVGGGFDNDATSVYASIGGGQGNVTSGGTGTVGHMTISGGKTNTASGLYSTVTGGLNNTASGLYATAGGQGNTAGDGETVFGQYTTAGTARAFAIGAGTVVTPSNVLEVYKSSGVVLNPASQPGETIAGMMYYDSTENRIKFYNGVEWLGIGDDPTTVQGEVGNFNGTDNTICQAVGQVFSTIYMSLATPNVIAVGDILYTDAAGTTPSVGTPGTWKCLKTPDTTQYAAEWDANGVVTSV